MTNVLPAELPQIALTENQWRAFDGERIKVHINWVDFNFYVDVAPDADPEHVGRVYDQCIYARGLEPIPEDECPAEALDDGWLRIYCVPVVPVDDTPVHRKRLRKRLYYCIAASPAVFLAAWQAVDLVTAVFG